MRHIIMRESFSCATNYLDVRGVREVVTIATTTTIII
jgi:hypothetical protein